MKVEFDEAQKRVMDELLLKLPGAKAGKMFGFPGYWTDGKLFACLFGPGIGFKLPPDRATEVLKKPGFVPFTPRGKQMAAWVMLKPKRAADLRRSSPCSASHSATSPDCARRRGILRDGGPPPDTGRLAT